MMLSALIYVIYIVIVGVVIGLLMYLIDAIPLPEPFARVARIALLVVSGEWLGCLVGDDAVNLEHGERDYQCEDYPLKGRQWVGHPVAPHPVTPSFHVSDPFGAGTVTPQRLAAASAGELV
jgi:hypothetical protein